MAPDYVIPNEDPWPLPLRGTPVGFYVNIVRAQADLLLDHYPDRCVTYLLTTKSVLSVFQLSVVSSILKTTNVHYNWYVLRLLDCSGDREGCCTSNLLLVFYVSMTTDSEFCTARMKGMKVNRLLSSIAKIDFMCNDLLSFDPMIRFRVPRDNRASK